MINEYVRRALRDYTPEQSNLAANLLHDAELIYQEACTFMDYAVEIVTERLPQIEERKRGKETVYRYPSKNLDVVAALLLVKIRGNVKAAMTLIEGGYFLEWKMILRTIINSIEDVWFLWCEKDKNTRSFRRYVDSFFDEELDNDGEFTKRRASIVGRPEIYKAILESDIPTEYAKSIIVGMGKKVQRVLSGSVHGRASSIIVAYFAELTGIREWSADRSNRRFMMFAEKHTFYQMAAIASLTVSMVGAGKWWGIDRVLLAVDICQKMMEAVNGKKESPPSL